MTKTRLLLAFLAGSGSVAITLLLFPSSENLGPVVLLAFPGMIISIIASGNVHVFKPWVAAVGNFAFYFATVYAGGAVREAFRQQTKIGTGR